MIAWGDREYNALARCYAYSMAFMVIKRKGRYDGLGKLEILKRNGKSLYKTIRRVAECNVNCL